MRRKPVVLVTGANGEMGQALIQRLALDSSQDILALDVRAVEAEVSKHCVSTIVGDILHKPLLERLITEYEIHAIFHLAALLSTRSEFSPETAHDVNVTGTLNLLRLAVEQSRWHGKQVKFLFPSSIAVYGLDLETKRKAGKVNEASYTMPTTMYGCNKLYGEHLGRYFAHHYRQLAAEEERHGVDFRSIRFPGLVSAFTVPSGGTSDYLPEMIHAAAKGERYECFVRPDSRIPFMAMPDAIDALMALMQADAKSLTRPAYNIAAFNPSAEEFAARVKRAFPKADISYVPDLRRQAIVDSWPEDIDDAPAQRDFGFKAAYDFERMFAEYLLPNVTKRYQKGA